MASTTRVIDLDGSPPEILATLDASAIAVTKSPELRAMVAALQASEHVIAVCSRERMLVDAPIEQLVSGPVHRERVGHFAQRTRCIAKVVALAEANHVSRTRLAAIEQGIDELVMNALYDAPIDEAGKPIFAGLPTKTRAMLRVEQEVEVHYACDGKRFAIAVRDAFGSLERKTVLRFLHKGLHAEDKVDRKAGGAGLGLFLLASTASAISFRISPGVSTEVVCTFDLEPGTLEQLAIVVGNPGATRAHAKRLYPAHRRALLSGRSAVLLAGVVVLGAGGIAASRFLDAPAPQPTSTVELDTQPSGAAIVVDGKPMGGAPLRLSTLTPGATVSVAFKHVGYRDVTVGVQAPSAGEVKKLIQVLERTDEHARVRLFSNPPGAQVLRDGRAVALGRTYTPAEVFVEAGQPQNFTLVMPTRVPLVIPPFVAARGGNVEKGGDLVPGATLLIEGPAGGTVRVVDAITCLDLAVPARCTLAPGRYVVEYTSSDQRGARRTVDLAGEDLTIRFPRP